MEHYRKLCTLFLVIYDIVLILSEVKDLAFSPHEAKEPITKVTCRRNAAPPHTPSPLHNQSNMRRVHRYYVYILTSSSRRALYTGITNNLPLRVCQHREALEGFTAHYKSGASSTMRSSLMCAMPSTGKRKSKAGPAGRKIALYPKRIHPGEISPPILD